MDGEHYKLVIYKMKIEKKFWKVIVFTILYVLAFAIYYLSIQNYEFLWYIAVLVFFFCLILFTLNKTKFDLVILWGLSIWGFLHMCGGGIIINGDVMYNLVLIKILEIGGNVLLKFDQLVHAYGFGVTTLVAYHLLKPHLNKTVSWKIVYPLLVLVSMGLGALNEVVEFVAVLGIPNTNVGGYVNTALDLVFNTIGAIISVVIIHIRRKYSKTY